MRWQYWAKRSTSATTQAAPGKTVPHSTPIVNGPDEVTLGPRPEIAAMLRADKIQNYKDVLLYHRDTCPRRGKLHRNFRIWLERLGVSLERFADWFERLRAAGARVSVAQVR